MSIKLELFASPGCSNCGRAAEVLCELAEEIGGGRIEWRKVNVLEELDYAVNLGVLSTPAIAIDGELVFTGLPPLHKLLSELDRRISAKGETSSI